MKSSRLFKLRENGSKQMNPKQNPLVKYLAKVINNKGGHKSNEHCRACMFSKAECVYLQNKIETLIKNKKC